MTARSHRLADKFVIRAPVLPFSALTQGDVMTWLADPAVREALFVASPELSAALDSGARDPAVLRAALRYVTRMASRATPFGLFSGVALGTFAQATELRIRRRGEHARHTRLDNDYLAKLCDVIGADPTLRRELRFQPTTSLYRVADKYRYAVGRLVGSVREYHLVAIDATPYLDAVIERARGGAVLEELATVLAADPELTRDEIDTYLHDLAAAGVIVPAIAPHVTGSEPAVLVRATLGAMPSARVAAGVLDDVTARLAAIDTAGGAPPDAYRAVAATLARLPVEATLSRLFQVDLALRAPAMTLGQRVASEITRAFELVRKLSPVRDNETWARFRDAFTARYETREVPLVDVLDEESGIGFGNAAGDTAQAPLICDLAFPPPPDAPAGKWTPRDATLLGLLVDSAGSHEVELSDADVARLAREPAPLADTVAFSFQLAARSAEALDRGEFTIDARGVTAASATRMLGRFCHASPEIHAHVVELCAREQERAGDALLAEIVHLPEGRIGNILLRPVLRGYEITYMGASGAAPDRQILVSDLLVSVRGKRVVVRSRRLGREIRPQMATAHNVTERSLAIYRFLSAHAIQLTEGGGFTWGALAQLPFLPRVRHRNVVLARATWRLAQSELAKLTDVAAARALRDRRKLPRWVVLADFDNELAVDFENDISLDAFVHLVKSRGEAKLIELHPPPDELVVDSADGRHTHELIATFVREEPAPAAVRAAAPPGLIQRRFPPGSSWLYAKLYAGTSTIDALLRDVIAPFTRTVRHAIDGWFFIRYSDPDHHVRVRFHGESARLIAEVLPALSAAIEPAIAQGLVWKLQLDTYEREVERYGGDRGMVASEQLFAADSEAVITIVEHTPGDDGASVRWKLAVLGLDLLARDLGLAMPERLALATRVRDRFAAEHQVDTAFQKRLGDKFRAHKNELAVLLDAPLDDAEHDYAPALAAFAARSAAIAPLAAELRSTGTIDELLASYWHMHVNRLLPSMQRRQELVLYDLLRRHYEGIIARKRVS